MTDRFKRWPQELAGGIRWSPGFSRSKKSHAPHFGPAEAGTPTPVVPVVADCFISDREQYNDARLEVPRPNHGLTTRGHVVAIAEECLFFLGWQR